MDQLHEARVNLFRLWAIVEQVPQARYGVTALLDSGARMPPAIAKSVPGTSLGGVLAAACYLSHVLGELQQRLGSQGAYDLPEEFAAFVAADLAQAEAERSLG